MFVENNTVQDDQALDVTDINILLNMLNGYLKYDDNNMYQAFGMNIVPYVTDILKRGERSPNVINIFGMDWYSLSDSQNQVIKYTSDAMVISELKDYYSNSLYYRKNTSSLVNANGFMWDIVHKFPNLKRINIMGLFMEDSIKDTANSVIDLFDSYGMNIEVRVILDASVDYDFSNRDNTLKEMNKRIKTLKRI